MLPEAKNLFPLHWKELALFKDEIPMDMDEAKYAALEQNGVLLTVTARDKGRLVGYFTWFLMPHLHYASSGRMAITDMYFVLPEYRKGAGLKLFLESERVLREMGIVKAVTSCKVHMDNTPFLKKLGWQLTDYTFCKMMKEGACR